jgi:hypothetical protein
MTTPIISTDTASTAAVDSTLNVSALASWKSAAACACMAAGIIGTGHLVVHPNYSVCRHRTSGGAVEEYPWTSLATTTWNRTCSIP